MHLLLFVFQGKPHFFKIHGLLTLDSNMLILTRLSTFWDDTFPVTLLIKTVVGVTTQKFPFHIFVLVYAINLNSYYKLMSASHCFVFQEEVKLFLSAQILFTLKAIC